MSSLSFLTSLCFFDANLRIIGQTAGSAHSFFPLQSRKSFAERKKPLIFAVLKARMAESVDALDSKSSARKGVRVRPPLRVLPYQRLCNLLARPFCFSPPCTCHFRQERSPIVSSQPPPQFSLVRHKIRNSSNRPFRNLLSPSRLPYPSKHKKKPAAFPGRRLKSTVERSTITGNPDSQGSG